jgi:hypothetical protein
MNHDEATAQPAPLGQVERGVGRPAPERDRTCEQGCNGCDDCTDYDDEPDDQCLHCRGDGMDPDCDYLLPCPDCGGSW